ncbi:MAG: pyridoxamine 5'-phosphate oxidase family protein [Chloroflexi bacterium]|nr:pyridoxamine 5'-phosphate oxidase family protein [Chloroflexota bacterium]
MAIAFTDTISTVEQLRTVMAMPSEPALRKEMSRLDDGCRWFIERAPFVFIATSGADGRCDVSPKGDVPGFVQVLDDETLVLPDRPGNNRADSITNILQNPHIGMIFVVPGADWTLRVNGRATIVRDDAVLERCAVDGRRPALGIAVHVEEAYMHCPKCIIRSKLWDPATQLAPEDLPSFALMARDQAGYQQVPAEVVEKMDAESNKKLY